MEKLAPGFFDHFNPISSKFKGLGGDFDCRLTFEQQITTVALTALVSHIFSSFEVKG